MDTTSNTFDAAMPGRLLTTTDDPRSPAPIRGVDARLAAAEERFDAVFSAMHEGMALCEAVLGSDGEIGDFRFVDVNPAFVRQTRLPRERVAGRTLRQVLRQEASVWVEAFRTVAETGEPATLEDVRGPGRRSFEVYVSRPAPGRVVASSFDTTERRAATGALRESERRFRAVVESSHTGLMIVREERVVFANPALSAILGYPLEKIVGAPFCAALVAEDRPRVEENQRRLQSGEGGLKALSVRAIRADGATVYLQVLTDLVTYDDQPALLVNVVDVTESKRVEDELRRVRDHLEERVAERTAELFAKNERLATEIEERKKIEEELLSSRRQLAQAMDQARLVNWKFDATTGTFTFNDGFWALYGTTADREGGYEMSADDYVRSFVHPEDVALAVSEIGAAMREGSTSEQGRIEHRIIRRDGEVRYIEVNYYVQRDPQGRALGTQGANQDLTDRRRAEEELRNLAHAIDQSPLSVVITNRRGDIEYVNPGFTRVSGFTREEALGQNPSLLKSGQHTREFYNVLWRTLMTGNTWNGQLCNRTRSGELYWEDATISPVRDAQGKITHFVAVKEDVTEKRQIAEELRRAKDAADAANRAKSEFLARMSHEIRTPLNGVIGMTHLLSQTSQSPIQSQYTRNIRGASHRLLSVINDILDFSKIEAGKLELERAEFDIDDVLDELATIIGVTAGQKGLEVVIQRDRAVPVPLFGDPLRLGQVLLNLVSNAVKFTDTGDVVVHASLVDDGPARVTLHFSVSDTGIGISEEEQVRLFQAFSQADVTTTRRYGGTGLGLAISQRLVEMMGGEIRVGSKPGSGTTFEFTVSLDRQTAERRQRPGAPPDMAHKHVLVVDDNARCRRAVTALLTEAGLEVRAAEGIDEALGMVEGEPTPFDLVLLDWRLPGTDPREALARLRRAPALTHVPVAAMAPTAVADDAAAAVEASLVDEVVLKPSSPSALFETVLSALGRERRGERRRPGGAGLVRDVAETLRTAHVLVVEDDELNRQVAQKILQRAGVEVSLAVDGADAVARVSQIGEGLSAILMDLRMPELDGWEATRAIKADGRFGALPVIALTADAVSGVREACLAAGMCDFVTKPFDPAELLATISRWVRSSGPGRDALRSEPVARSTQAARPPAQVPRPASPAPALLPDALPGLDVRLGLARVGDDAELYRELLAAFSKTYGDAAERIATLHGSGQREDALRIAHTVKGLAGTLGGKRLQSAAAELEWALGAGGPARERAHGAFAAALAEVVSGLRDVNTAGAAPEAAAPAGEPADLSALRGEAERLAGLIEDQDIEASSASQRLAASLAGSPAGERARAVAEALTLYDFRQARSALDSLHRALGMAHTTEARDDDGR